MTTPPPRLPAPTLLAVIGAAAVVFLAAAPLPWAARLLTTLLLVPLPALMVLQARQLAVLPPIPRPHAYASSIISLWGLALITAIVARLSGWTPAQLGLVPLPYSQLLLWTAAVAAVSTLALQVTLRRGATESDTLLQLLPRTRNERILFAALSLTAGVCEEFIFRSFLIFALVQGTGSLTLAVTLAAGAFGMVHAYQLLRGALRATVLGLLLTVPYLATGSILPSMLGHIAIDIIGGLVLGPRIMRQMEDDGS